MFGSCGPVVMLISQSSFDFYGQNEMLFINLIKIHTPDTVCC